MLIGLFTERQSMTTCSLLKSLIQPRRDVTSILMSSLRVRRGRLAIFDSLTRMMIHRGRKFVFVDQILVPCFSIRTPRGSTPLFRMRSTEMIIEMILLQVDDK